MSEIDYKPWSVVFLQSQNHSARLFCYGHYVETVSAFTARGLLNKVENKVARRMGTTGRALRRDEHEQMRFWREVVK